MLYKKYHRNFVSQFKKGTKVKISIIDPSNDKYCEVIEEPFINKDGILIRGRRSPLESNILLFVVFISGRLRNFKSFRPVLTVVE